MHVDIELKGGKKVNTEDRCGDVCNMTDLVVDTTESKIQFHGNNMHCYFRAVGSPKALPLPL